MRASTVYPSRYPTLEETMNAFYQHHKHSATRPPQTECVLCRTGGSARQGDQTLAGRRPPAAAGGHRPSGLTATDRHYPALRGTMSQLFEQLGIAA
jgi:hypothetical protein